METKPTILKKEIKIKVAKRVPPGDFWQPLDNTTLVLNSLTDVLEYIYQKTENTQFYMDAREGYVYTIGIKEEMIPPTPAKTWSLYGEE